MAVCRMRMRITMLRMRIRMSARVWKSKYIGVQRWGRAPRCGAEGNEPQQQRLMKGRKAETSSVGQ